MEIRRSKHTPFLAVSMFLLGPWLHPATAQLLGPEFEVNTYTPNGQGYSAVAADGAGNFVVVWQSAGQDGAGYGVFGQRFNPGGVPVGSEFQVTTETVGNQWYPAVAAAATGNFVVVWQSAGQDGAGYGVFAQRFNSAGSPVGGEFQVNSYTMNAQAYPAVAVDGLGNFVVVWQSADQNGALDDVFGQRFDATGVPAGNEFQVNTYMANVQGDPAVAADGSGNFIVVWESYATDGSSTGLAGQRFDAVGLPAGSEFQVNTYTTGVQEYPVVAAAAAGNFVVVWHSLGQDGSDYGVFGQRFNSAGVPGGSEFQVNTYTTNNQWLPAVAADTPGNFVVVWHSFGQDGSNYGVFGQRFNSAGSRVGGEFQVNSYTTSEQGWPAVAAGGSGNFVVTWESLLQDGSSYNVFGKRLTVTIFSNGFNAGDACAWSASVGGGC